MIAVSARNGGIIFSVRMIPGARRDSIDGELDGALKVHLTAQPVDGRANDALSGALFERSFFGC